MDSLGLPTAALEKLTISGFVTATHPPASENLTVFGSIDSPLTDVFENLTISGSTNSPAISSKIFTAASTNADAAIKNPNSKARRRTEKSMDRRLHYLCAYLRKYYNRKTKSRNGFIPQQNPSAELSYSGPREEINTWRESRRRSRIIIRMCRRGIVEPKTVDNVLEFEKKNPNSEIGEQISRLMRDIGDCKIRYNYRELMEKGEQVYNLINSI